MNGEAIGATVTIKLVVARQHAADVIAQVASTARPDVETISNQGKSWEPLLARLDAVVRLGDILVEVGIDLYLNSKPALMLTATLQLIPIAKLAWGVVELGYNVRHSAHTIA